jgi:hypothetical protein
MTSLIGFACYLPLILALATLVRWEYKRMRRARLSGSAWKCCKKVL